VRHVPTPVLHSFAGLALGKLIRDAPAAQRWQLVIPAAFLLAGNAPDLDFIAGMLIGDPFEFHRGASHSLTAAVIFGLGSFLAARLAALRSPGRFSLLMCTAYVTHIVLDMLSPLGDPERGVKVAWPFLSEQMSFPVRILIGVRFDPRAEGFWEGLLYQAHNFLVVASEILIVALIWFGWRLRNGRSANHYFKGG
jgi:inner membrane protein